MAEKKNITGEYPELPEQSGAESRRQNEGLGQRALEERMSELKEREEGYQAMFNTMLEGFCIIEVLFDAHDRPVDYRFLEINPSFETQTGLRNAQGKRMRELVPEHESYWYELYGKIAMTGEQLHFENEAKALNRWYEVSASRIGGQDSRKVAILFYDITERKRAEKALWESEYEKRLILDNANESIAYHDAEQNLIWANRAYQAATMPLSQLKGRKCYTCWGLDRLCIKCPVSEAIRTGDPQSAELSPRNQPHWPADQGAWFVKAAPVKNSDGIVISVIEIAHDITESKWAEEELQVSHDQLRALAANLQTVREEERTRVARDIHDVLAQGLIRLKIDLVWLKGQLLKPGKALMLKTLAARVEEMTQMADDAIQCVQRIATGLRPAVLDSLGLCAAIEWQARDFKNHTGISCNAIFSDKELLIGGDIATAVFRILQESLTNVQRHASATRVDIVLRQEAGQLLLKIHDNGCGIPEEKLNSQMSIGLTDMKERALLLGGHFEVRSRPESGTTIEVRLPLAKTEKI